MLFYRKTEIFVGFQEKKTRKKRKNEKKRDPKKNRDFEENKNEISFKNREIPTLYSIVYRIKFSIRCTF
jgi:hypothetical protein